MTNRNIFILLWALLGLAYLGGMFLHVMEVDAAQYAVMSLEMLKSKNFLQLFDGGVPYLDKPPLLFWLSSLSFYLFGVSDFAYRLPSFLATILAIYSTYKLAKQWYGNTIAVWSALILASCQAFFLFNMDVKTDNLLTCWVIFSIWQLSSYITGRKFINLVLGFVGIGLAMLSKGPIGLIVPAAAIGSHLLLHRNWKAIFDFQWLLGILVIGIVLSPMLYGLYEQWGTEGIKFYFWTQSFGRITGANTWNNNAGYFFFVHTYLWAFLPWSICSLAGVFFSLKELIVKRFKLDKDQEGMTVTGLVLVFIALSMSHYKLPHYIFVLFPLAAIVSARWIYQTAEMKSGTFKWFSGIQLFVYILLLAGVFMILWLVFQPVNYFLFAVSMFMVIGAIAIAIKGIGPFQKIILPGVLCMAAVNMGMNWDFYPCLLKYQASSEAGSFITDHKVPDNRFYLLNYCGSHSLDFYAQRIMQPVFPENIPDTLKKRDIWLYLDEKDYSGLAGCTRFAGDQDIRFDNKSVQYLTFQFLNPNTRSSTLNHTWLVHLARTDSLQNGVK